jgi:hypothetical protein
VVSQQVEQLQLVVPPLVWGAHRFQRGSPENFDHHRRYHHGSSWLLKRETIYKDLIRYQALFQHILYKGTRETMQIDFISRTTDKYCKYLSLFGSANNTW